MANRTDAVMATPALARIVLRLDREIHNVLTRIGAAEQRTDEFVDQEPLVKGFLAAWIAAAESLEATVIAQIEAGETTVAQ